MKGKYIGAYAEHYILSELFKRDIEAYIAIKANQPYYDITIILNDNSIKRIQVKATAFSTTKIEGASTNNPIKINDFGYDYLALVMIVDNEQLVFWLTTEEVLVIKKGKKQLPAKKRDGGKYVINPDLQEHKDAWHKITNSQN